MNITDEQIEAVAARRCERKDCGGCAIGEKDKEIYASECVEKLVTRCAELIRERRENPGVWDGAPERSSNARVTWWGENELIAIGQSETYHRTPPKDAKRLLAERIASAWMQSPTTANMVDVFERELRKES